jgi:hypothetical protein
MIAAGRRLGVHREPLVVLDGLLGLPVGQEGRGQALPDGQRVLVPRPEQPPGVGQQQLVRGQRLLAPGRRLVRARQVRPRGQGDRMPRAEVPAGRRHHLLVQHHRLGRPAGARVGVGEVPARGERVRVLGSLVALAIGQRGE